MGCGKRDTAERGYAFGQLVHQLDLLRVVLIEEEVQLVEGDSGDLPVMLLVQVAQHHRVGEYLVQRVATSRTYIFPEPDRYGIDCSKLLDNILFPALPLSGIRDSSQNHCVLLTDCSSAR